MSEDTMPEPKPKRRWCQHGWGTILAGFSAVVVIGLAISLVQFIVSQRQYYGLVRETRSKIESLHTRQPPGVRPDQWERAVGWTSNVICQIYFSPNHGDLDSLRYLCESLDQEIAGQVDLTTLQWVWEQCEKAEGHGQVYAIRFRDVRLLTVGPITDERLPEVWSLHKCLWLDLSNSRVSDAGLQHLTGLTNLERLDLRSSKVTAEGVKRLQNALPNCKIDY